MCRATRKAPGDSRRGLKFRLMALAVAETQSVGAIGVVAGDGQLVAESRPPLSKTTAGLCSSMPIPSDPFVDRVPTVARIPA